MVSKDYENIKEFLDGSNSLFKTIKIEIGLEGINNRDTDCASRMYKISHILCDDTLNEDEQNYKKIKEFVEGLNSEINNSENTGFKAHDSGWSIFFLIKECIQNFCSVGYKYYRGQSNGAWETIPSAFRSHSDDSGKEYYKEFEDIYKEVHKKYPDRVSYIEIPSEDREFDKKLEERGQELALLQHYDLYTPLLDITSNPYIALLFMIYGELQNPQLEFYNISKTPLFFQPDESKLNSRIRAQSGAFLNYEFLLSMVDGEKLLSKLKAGENKYKIPRILLSIKYLEENTELLIKKEGDIGKKLAQGNSEYHELLNSVNASIDIPTNKKTVYEDVRNHLRKKLSEFQYFEANLFPDFEDFLKNKMKQFLSKEN